MVFRFVVEFLKLCPGHAEECILPSNYVAFTDLTLRGTQGGHIRRYNASLHEDLQRVFFRGVTRPQF